MCIRDRLSRDGLTGDDAVNVAAHDGGDQAVPVQLDNLDVLAPVSYTHLDVYKRQALERGDAAAAAAMRKALQSVLRQEAKDIHDKYIEVPYTTSFGILFLPFEGLYAEVVSSGITDVYKRQSWPSCCLPTARRTALPTSS